MYDVKQIVWRAVDVISARQCRAARGALGWSQGELADRARVSRSMIVDFEKGTRMPIEATIGSVRDALETAGMTFVFGGDGVAGVLFDQSDGD